MNHATASGTAQRAAQAVNGLTYRAGWDSLTLSAFGLGAGRARLAPAALPAVIQHYLAHGGNLLDAQSQPAAMGAGLAQARAAGALRREHIIVCAEGGPGEADGPDLSPAEVRRQVRAALQALGLARLDLFWLTGADALSAQAGEAELRFHLREAFAALEVAVAQDEISAYGLALADLAFPPSSARAAPAGRGVVPRAGARPGRPDVAGHHQPAPATAASRAGRSRDCGGRRLAGSRPLNNLHA